MINTKLNEDRVCPVLDLHASVGTFCDLSNTDRQAGITWHDHLQNGPPHQIFCFVATLFPGNLPFMVVYPHDTKNARLVMLLSRGKTDGLRRDSSVVG